MMFLPAALLILLSVASAEDAKRCFWCGPLAEQVHRSQRAPSCGPELEETTCDPGYTHCAVVVISPPYAESRLCVKFYQDECYSLYCNTSKTWRMICPCKGDLCNGQNTERETRAFAALAKIVAKNKRSKRCLGPKGFLPLTPRKKIENHNDTFTSETETTENAISTDLTDELVEAQTVITDLLNGQETDNDVDNDIGDTNQDSESEMQGDQPIENEVSATTEVNVDETKNYEQSETTETEDIETNNEATNIEDIKTNNVESATAIIEENKENIQTITIPAEFAKLEDTNEIPTATSMKPTTIEIELSVVHITNPNDNLPPPEALQQNVTPAKATVPTTSGTIEMTKTTQIETTTQSMKEVTKKIEKTPDTLKNNVKKNEDSGDKDKGGKNGEQQTLVHVWKLVVLMNILIYITL